MADSNDFPLMLYRGGGTQDIHGGKFHTLIVADKAERDAALASGWFLTTPEARDAHEAQQAAEQAAEAAPARRKGRGSAAE